VIIAVSGEPTPEATGPQEACSTNGSPFGIRAEPLATDQKPTALLPPHWAELEASGIAADVAALNVASFGPGTDRHWETEREELVRFKRFQIQTASTTASGYQQNQPGHLSDRLVALDQRYRHLKHGGWRIISATLPGLEPFSQWKPDRPRGTGEKDIKYESPPAHPNGGGALFPHVPERCWQLICKRHGLPFPESSTVAEGFWPWALKTAKLPILICEGWKKALAAISAGHAAVAVPGINMGWRTNKETSHRQLIPELEALNSKGRPWLVVFDAEKKQVTARNVAAAAGTLAYLLRQGGSKPDIARLPLLKGTTKTGLDDLWVAGGAEALDRALAEIGPRPVLPQMPAADRIIPHGQYISESGPLPSPAEAPLVVLDAPMGTGKTKAIAERVAPLLSEGVPILAIYHRESLGQAGAQVIGIPWKPQPGSDERQQGAGLCWDSCCPGSAIRISGTGFPGAVIILDEWMQAVEHVLTSRGTEIKNRRLPVMQTFAELAAGHLQVIAGDAQMATWGVDLLKTLTGKPAYVIRSEHQPMVGRPLYVPRGFRSPSQVSEAFHAQWLKLVQSRQEFLCWTSSQKGEYRNSAQRLAKEHKQIEPKSHTVVIDSTTPELAAELAADPDGFIERERTKAQSQGQTLALYVTPAISSGVSFDRWKPNAVLAYSGGKIAPEHVAQALARVRCPDVPCYVYAPERCPGDALRVGSGDTSPEELLRNCGAVLRRKLEAAGNPWLKAWAELGAIRNKQNFAYVATIAGLLEREGWELQDCWGLPKGDPKGISQTLSEQAKAARAANDQTLLEARAIPDLEAEKLKSCRRRLTPSETAELSHHRLCKRWGTTKPTQVILDADRDGLREKLRLGWILTNPTASTLVPLHDWLQLQAIADGEEAFAPDQLCIALRHKLSALQALQIPELLERFAAGETIAANDPAVELLHERACQYRPQVIAALGISPGKLVTGTLRNFLDAVGWKLTQTGRIKARGEARDKGLYQAAPIREIGGQSLDMEELRRIWLQELQTGPGAKINHMEKFYMVEKGPTPGESLPPCSASIPTHPYLTIPRPIKDPSRGFASADPPALARLDKQPVA